MFREDNLVQETLFKRSYAETKDIVETNLNIYTKSLQKL